MSSQSELPHLDAHGSVHMVSVSQKPASLRWARAQGELRTEARVVDLVLAGQAPKGDVLAVARVAAIMAAKRTAEWIPLAHPIPLTGVQAEIEPFWGPGSHDGGFRVRVRVETRAPTGVEMEALTAVTAGLLTLYDMLKAQDRTMTLTEVHLLEKHGGRSGDYVRPDAPDRSPAKEE